VTFVPGPGLKEAVYEALDAGIKFIVMPVERVPLYDILEMMAYGKQKGARLLGPGSIELSVLVSRQLVGLEALRSLQKSVCAGLWGSFQEAAGNLEQSHGPSKRQALE